MSGEDSPKVLVVELLDDTDFAEAARVVGAALAGTGLKRAYTAVGSDARAVHAAVQDRTDPPAGYTVRDFGLGGWSARAPDGSEIACGWPSRRAAVERCWAHYDQPWPPPADRERAAGRGGPPTRRP